MSRRRRVTTVAAGLVVVGALVSVPLSPSWITGWLARRSSEVLYFVGTDRPVVALTIDDGPDSVATPEILDVLKQHGARATFFVITDRVPGNEHVLGRMLEEGHEIANHLTSDEPSIRLSPSDFEHKLLAADEVLTAYSPMRWFRPGSGWFNDDMLVTLHKHGYTNVLGSVYPFDAAIPWSWFASRYILWNVQPGSIVVLHDVGSRGLRTAATLRTILPELQAKGYDVVTVSTLTGMPGRDS